MEAASLPKCLQYSSGTSRCCTLAAVQLLHHVVECGAHGATVNWPAEAAEALAAKGKLAEPCGKSGQQDQ